MRLLLAGILSLLPFGVWAEPPHTIKTDLFDPPVALDPALPSDAGNADDQPGDGTQLGQYGNPYSPASATNFELLTTPSPYDQGQLSQNTYEPDWLKDPFGRYGSPYSPDPMNQRYDVGNLYSPGSLMNLYSRGGQMERR